MSLVGMFVERPCQLPVRVLNVPRVAQETSFSCGSAAVTSVARYFGVHVERERDLWRKIAMSDVGVSPEDVKRAALSLGLHASVENGSSLLDLARLLNLGIPPILDVQMWESDEAPEEGCHDGHFVILVGLNGQTAYVMDPSEGDYAWLPIRSLLERWHDRPTPGRPCEDRVMVVVRGAPPTPRTRQITPGRRYR
jgi:predicted double-glycine peptidase